MITEEYALPSSGMSDDLMSKTGWCDDVRYISNGEFVVTEGGLREVFSQAVSMNVAD